MHKVDPNESGGDISEKDTGATQSEGWGHSLSFEEGIRKCGLCMVLNQKGGTKCDVCETEQPVHEEKLDVSISADGSEALTSSILGTGGLKFGGLWIEGKPDVSSVRNIFEGSCTEEGKGSGKDIFEVGFNFSASEERDNFDRTDSAAQI